MRPLTPAAHSQRTSVHQTSLSTHRYRINRIVDARAQDFTDPHQPQSLAELEAFAESTRSNSNYIIAEVIELFVASCVVTEPLCNPDSRATPRLASLLTTSPSLPRSARACPARTWTTPSRTWARRRASPSSWLARCHFWSRGASTCQRTCGEHPPGAWKTS